MDDFTKLLLKASRERDSKVILNADTPDWKLLCSFLKKNSGGLAGVKVQPEYPLIWGMSHEATIRELKSMTHGLPILVDAKLADIDNSNLMKANFYFGRGYDAITVHAFEGEDAVRPVVRLAREMGRGALMIAAMTSKGNMFTKEQTGRIVRTAKRLRAAGVIAPGNDYKTLAGVRALLGRNGLILATGIGAQGGIAEKALKYSDFVMIGRSLLENQRAQKTI